MIIHIFVLGFHLTNNIVNMLHTGKTDYKGTPIVPEHIDLDEIKAMKSPRALAFHTHFDLLPKQLRQEGKAKIIYLIRNPKDVLVSNWHMNVKMTDGVYVGNFRGMFRRFLQKECTDIDKY